MGQSSLGAKALFLDPIFNSYVAEAVALQSYFGTQHRSSQSTSSLWGPSLWAFVFQMLFGSFLFQERRRIQDARVLCVRAGALLRLGLNTCKYDGI